MFAAVFVDFEESW